ncbi:MAG: CPBP family intramembrane metalloprotease [Ruminococcaceae bacterium]|nr:CPBP family intramembrane metalloprotease [Oscillospiraceae bacterium]
MNNIDFIQIPDENKIKYRKTVDVIAIGLLLQTLLSEGSSYLFLVLSGAFSAFGLTKGSIAYNNISSGADIIVYALVFLLPALFILKYAPEKNSSIGNKIKLPKNFISVLFAFLGCIAVCGSITAIIKVSIEEIGIGFHTFEFTIPHDILGTILFIVSSAVIPAIVEELLFRKAILGNLLPYGKWFAVILSSVCFSLMHRNPSQTIYTFVGGIILAVVVINSNSVFPAMLLHFLNNLLSVVYMLIYEYASEQTYLLVVSCIDIVLQLCGIIFVCVLFGKGFFELESHSDGLTFSPTKNLVRIYFVVYVLYSLFLSLRWVYAI